MNADQPRRLHAYDLRCNNVTVQGTFSFWVVRRAGTDFSTIRSTRGMSPAECRKRFYLVRLGISGPYSAR
jgi:hypothetical protein